MASRTHVSSDLIHVLTPQELKRLNSGENITIEETFIIIMMARRN